ncbi:MAG: DNA recombination protein RmuC [Eubacteriales bacterium]|nr:DNA recombination protein RmuC [Eubacteriales bacterium]MDY4008954.1 DNA recombination protein RmuC [Candidatus Limiplasma sp.]
MAFFADAQAARLLLAALGALCLALLILCLCMQARTRRFLRRMHEEQLRGQDAQANDVAQQNARQREELLQSMHQLNESLTNTFGGISRAQGEQVNALIRQSYDNAQAFDLRQQGMQRITEDSLKRIEGRMQAGEAATARALSQNEARLEALRRAVEEGLRLLREENAQKLSEMRQTVDEKLSDTLEKRLSASFSQVSERLEQVYRSLGEVHSLASGVGDLKRMLGNVKTRGVWGEIQLGALLEQALTDTQYQRNVAVCPGSGERVEFAVCLPGREEGSAPVYLPIDSKFPQEDYARLTEAAQNGDQQAVESAQKALLNAVRTEARRIGKYIAPPHTTDFAVMFLPLEGLYAEVMRHAGVVEAIQREQRVLISGPSTLLALLNSLQMGFRTLAIEQRSAEVWKLLGAVKGDFGAFAALLQKTQEKLQQATDSIDTAFVKTRAIEKRLRRVETVEGEEARRMLGPSGEEET